MPDPLTFTADIAGIVGAVATVAALYIQLRKPKPAKPIMAPPMLIGAPINHRYGLGLR